LPDPPPAAATKVTAVPGGCGLPGFALSDALVAGGGGKGVKLNVTGVTGVIAIACGSTGGKVNPLAGSNVVLFPLKLPIFPSTKDSIRSRPKLSKLAV
jgi:hypothetical protein